MFKIEVATRDKVKLMLGLSGPSGSGKTYSALQLAYGITKDWSKIALADTENKSAKYYAGEKTGPWLHVDFPSTTPQAYHPMNWVKLIDLVEKQPSIDVLILDSISHEWQGKGGALELVDAAQNKFGAWKTVTPLHNAFIDKMRQSRLHIIATMRAVQDYVVEENAKGKKEPRKVGLKSNQREGTDYEFGIIFDIEMSHYAKTSKDRTGLFAEMGLFQITPHTGELLMKWANSGAAEVKVAEPEFEIPFGSSDKKTTEPEAKANVDQLKAMFSSAALKKITSEDLKHYLEEKYKIKESKQLTANQCWAVTALIESGKFYEGAFE